MAPEVASTSQPDPRLWIAALVLGATVMFGACVVDSSSFTDGLSGGASNDNYCGLYSVYGGLRLLGYQVDFRDLLKSEYLSSPRGSTVEELQRAATDHGAQCIALRNLTPASLRACAYPVVLHVKAEPVSKEFDHFVLYVGEVKGQAHIQDGAEGMKLLPYSELASIWDGVGLILSREPPDLHRIKSPHYVRLAIFACLLLVVSVISGRRQSSTTAAIPTVGVVMRSVSQAGMLLVAVGLWSLLYHFVNSDGLLAQPQGADNVRQAHFPQN